MTEQTLRTLACCQLAWMIERGRYVDECKAEWWRRWRLPYPQYRTANRIEVAA